MTDAIPQVALQARQMYVDGDPVSLIVAETGLTLDRVYYWLDGGNGRLPPILRRRAFGGIKGTASARRAFVARMMHAADYKMQQIEARMQSAGLDAGPGDVRELAMLARVARDLTAMDERKRPKQTSDRSNDEPVPRDVDELRESLLQKLDALAARDEAQAASESHE
jgi:hypothetical protein